LIQDSELSNIGTAGKFYGLIASNGAVVDAGQKGGGYDYTGLNGLGLNNGSVGNNRFAGYQDYTGTVNPSTLSTPVSQAILNQNTNGFNSTTGPQGFSDPGVGMMADVYAQCNDFGLTIVNRNYTNLELKVYHDMDSGGVGFVNYVTPAYANPLLIDTRYYAQSDAEVVSQRSMINMFRLAFDNFVVIGSGSVTLTKVASWADPNKTSGGTGSNYLGTVAATRTTVPPFFHVATGEFRYEYGITRGVSGVELSGSLVDGNYKLTFNTATIRAGNLNYGQPMSTQVSEVNFHRLFGDGNGDGMVDALDQVMMQATYGSRMGMANYAVWANFNLDRSIDGTDLTQFNLRFNRFKVRI
jgi:hypothetical protein